MKRKVVDANVGSASGGELFLYGHGVGNFALGFRAALPIHASGSFMGIVLNVVVLGLDCELLTEGGVGCSKVHGG